MDSSNQMSSDGGSSDYYKAQIPANASGVEIKDGVIHIEARHVIRYMLGNDFDKGNIFKAMCRLGRKAGVDEAYDKNKIVWFAEQLKEN